MDDVTQKGQLCELRVYHGVRLVTVYVPPSATVVQVCSLNVYKCIQDFTCLGEGVGLRTGAWNVSFNIIWWDNDTHNNFFYNP